MSNDRPKVGAGFIVVHNGKILLAKRKNAHGAGTYGSCGGHMEAGESVYDTMKREAMEELGIEVGNFRFVSCTNLIKYGKHYLDLSFEADILSGEPRIIDTEKIESVGWYPLHQLPEPLFEPVRIALAHRDNPGFFEVKE